MYLGFNVIGRMIEVYRPTLRAELLDLYPPLRKVFRRFPPYRLRDLAGRFRYVRLGMSEVMTYNFQSEIYKPQAVAPYSKISVDGKDGAAIGNLR